MSDTASVEDLVDETLRHLAIDRAADGSLRATTPGWFGEYLFGGFVLAQAVAAGCEFAPPDRRLHSLHAYFLRPVKANASITYSGGLLREGRSFATAQLEAEQDGKAVLSMLASFTADDAGYEYDLGRRETLPELDESAVESGPGPWVAAWAGPTEPLDDGTRESTHRMWFRIPAALPDDPHIHTALIAFATDWTGIGGRPLHLEGDTQGMVSLDHAAWFHRPPRADEWMFYDVHSLVNFGGRGLLRGVIRDREGRVVVSVAQEMRLTIVAT
jgi:acyl-CoA thioesterase II